MEELVLVRPTLEMEEAAMAYRREHLAHGESVLHGSALMDSLPYGQWVRRTLDNAHPDTIHGGWVQADTFFVLRRTDGRIIGMVDIRHALTTPFLAQMGGHIGYGVRPSERRKGYAASILGMALEHARALGLRRVMLSCYRDNEGSRRTILKWGGKKEREFVPADGKPVEVYWIEL